MAGLEFDKLACEHGLSDPTSVEFAQWLDAQDPLSEIRDAFLQPDAHRLESMTPLRFKRVDASGNLPAITYLCGNSLGLPPKMLADRLTEGLDQWAYLGVHAYAYGPLPASKYDVPVAEEFGKWIVGGESDEVAVTNNLSVNMHLLLTTFYQPTGEKNCILVEEQAFPSDYYAVESQIAWHGLDPADCIIKLRPRKNEWCLRTEDIIETIRQNARRIALIWLPGVQYVTGQFLDMEQITRAGHELAQCPVGWDLAHAVGNVPLELHAWDVDMAVWCSYKYLNASPGAIGGLFVHKKHHHLTGIHGPSPDHLAPAQGGPRLTGWWSHRAETRFDMTSRMELAPGAAAYRISNPSLLLLIALKTSVDIFRQCGGMEPVRRKSVRLTGYLDYLIRRSRLALPPEKCQIVTPADPAARGAQLTVWFADNVDYYHRELSEHGYICDVRHPNCIRITPCPLYTRFVDVRNFAEVLFKISTTRNM